MKIYNNGSNLSTPKNFSRKNRICSCLCALVTEDSTGSAESGKIYQGRVTVKYEVEPHSTSFYMFPKLKKNQWASYQSWGDFKKVVELPKIFEKLDEEKDFYIKTAYFLRDNIQMPFIYEIVITNFNKYSMIKLKDERKNKLLTLKTI